MFARPASRPTLRRFGLGVLTALVLLVAAGCFPGSSSGDPEKLEALRNDAMARYEPSGGRLLDDREVDEHTSFGKPGAAEITRVFSLPNGNLEMALRRTLEAAAAAGWIIEGPVVRSDDWFGRGGRKRLASGSAQLSAVAYPTGVPGGAAYGRAMVISLVHS